MTRSKTETSRVIRRKPWREGWGWALDSVDEMHIERLVTLAGAREAWGNRRPVCDALAALCDHGAPFHIGHEHGGEGIRYKHAEQYRHRTCPASPKPGDIDCLCHRMSTSGSMIEPADWQVGERIVLGVGLVPQDAHHGWGTPIAQTFLFCMHTATRRPACRAPKDGDVGVAKERVE